MKIFKKKVKLGTWIATLVVSFVILFPVVWIFSSSITDVSLLYSSPPRYFPKVPTFENYVSLFVTMDIFSMAKNTLIIATANIIINMVVSMLAAYGFARGHFRAKHLLLMILTFSSMIPMIVCLVPMSRLMLSLRLNDTYIGLSLLYTSTFIPFTTMIFTNSIKDIPMSIEEAADIDGIHVFGKIIKIIAPLLRPVIATMAIITFVWSLNEFFIPLLFAGKNTTPFSVGMSMIPKVDEWAIPWEKISALGTIILTPILIFIIIFQKNIMDGLMAGSVKQ